MVRYLMEVGGHLVIPATPFADANDPTQSITLQKHGIRHEALTSGPLAGSIPLFAAACEGHLPVVQYLFEVVAPLSLW